MKYFLIWCFLRLYLKTIHFIQLPINLRRRIFDFCSSSECKLSRLSKMVPLCYLLPSSRKKGLQLRTLISSHLSFHFYFFRLPVIFISLHSFLCVLLTDFFSSFIFSELQNSFVQDVSVWECFLPSSPFRWYLATVMPRCNSTYHFLSESLLFPIIRHCFNLI